MRLNVVHVILSSSKTIQCPGQSRVDHRTVSPGLPQYRRRRPVRSASEKALELQLLLSLRALVRVGVTSADEMTDG